MSTISTKWYGVITVFPEMFTGLTQQGICARAMNQGLASLNTWDLRDFAENKHATVDDRPYGGGPGMLMQVEPIRRALAAARQAAPANARVVYVTPAGRRFDHAYAQRLAEDPQPLIFIAGRYEGIDQRLIDHDVDEQISIGDYVLSGGELAIMVILDAVIRWIPGALGHAESAENDAFSAKGLLDHPHYTRPSDIAGEKVPAVLLGGDHAAIAQWRLKQALGQTWLYRPDLLANARLDANREKLLAEFQQEYRENSY